MRLPFTRDAFFGVFARYNEAVWPAQFLLLALAVIAVGLVFSRWRHRSRAVWLILAGFWVWTGLAYHLAHFAAVNPAARLFGVLCVVQGMLLSWLGTRTPEVAFDRPAGASGIVSGLLVGYALVAYPLLGSFLGHAYMASPTFGAPCPTTIFTFGMLWLVRPLPRYVLAVPIAWSAIGGSAAFVLGVRQDLGLVAAGLSGVCLLIAKRGRRSRDSHAGAAPGPGPDRDGEGRMRIRHSREMVPGPDRHVEGSDSCASTISKS